MSCLLSFHMRKLASLYQTTVSIKLPLLLRYWLNFTLTKESLSTVNQTIFFTKFCYELFFSLLALCCWVAGILAIFRSYFPD